MQTRIASKTIAIIRIRTRISGHQSPNSKFENGRRVAFDFKKQCIILFTKSMRICAVNLLCTKCVIMCTRGNTFSKTAAQGVDRIRIAGVYP